MLNGWVSYAMLKQDYTAVYWRTDVHIASIFAAAALYLLLRPHLGSIGAHPILRWLSPIALALGFAFSIEAMPAEYHFILGTLCFATAVITLEAAPNIIRAAFSWPALTWFGVLSYSLYLWQQPFYKLLDHYPAALPFLLAGALAAGLASYHFIEQPARRFLNRVWV
jgi:peptidoglycan/LPS O-acetylase OafA/YrhL